MKDVENNLITASNKQDTTLSLMLAVKSMTEYKILSKNLQADSLWDTEQPVLSYNSQPPFSFVTKTEVLYVKWVEVLGELINKTSGGSSALF